MSLPVIIYLIGIAEDVKTLFGFISAAGGVIYVVYVLFVVNEYGKSPVKWPAPLLLLAAFTASLIPPRETSYAMLAAYGVETVAQNERVQELASSSLKLIEQVVSDHLRSDGDEKER